MGGPLNPIAKTLTLKSVWTAVVGFGVSITFGAQAQFPSREPPPAPFLSAFPEQAPCPTSQLAPFGIVPQPAQARCKATGCLVPFKGYMWWTAFQYVGANYNNSYYYNGGLGTAFAPENVFLDSQGLHLRISQVDLGGGPTWAGAEAVLMFNANNSEANLGYGDYLVTAKLLSAPQSWSGLDPNVALGVFTYERYGPPPSGAANCTNNCPPWPSRGGSYNPYREIDLAEISRWGWNHTNDCPFTGTNGQFPNSVLCQGTAQFATQNFTQSSVSVQRYDIGTGQVVTLVLRWHGGKQPVTFEKYNGAFTLTTLPAAANYTWTPPSAPALPNFKTTTSAVLNNFIPNTPGTVPPQSCERFHINFWLGKPGRGPHPGPTNGQVQDAVITNFQFKPYP